MTATTTGACECGRKATDDYKGKGYCGPCFDEALTAESAPFRRAMREIIDEKIAEISPHSPAQGSTGPR